MTEPYKRRKYPLVNKSYQYRFLATILVYNLILVVFLVISLVVPDIIQMQDQTLGLEVRAAAADKILSIHSRIWPAIIALICVIGMHSFRAFHLFVGPLYRITMAFDRLREGDLSFRVKLRENDYLHREEEIFNSMLEKLAEKISIMKSAGMGAIKSLGELEHGINERNDWENTHTESLADLREHLDKLKDTADYFRLEKLDDEQSF